MPLPTRIISGGQTGVDRAALDVALELGIAHGGWCPLGRRAEDGVIDARYALEETDSVEPAIRTERNVRESDGTLILCRGPLAGGTALTLALAKRQRKPFLLVNELRPLPAAAVRDWLDHNHIAVLNVAGPRASSAPGIFEWARDYLRDVLRSPGAFG